MFTGAGPMRSTRTRIGCSGARGPVPQAHGGGPLDADPTWGYLTAPGEEQRFAHPSGGDVCTSIRVDPVLWRSLAGEPTRSSRPAV